MKEYQMEIIFAFTVFSLLVMIIPHAQAGNYKSSPFNLTSTPTLCEIEPKDNNFPYIGIMTLSTTHDSINDWLTQLNKGLGKDPIWNINEVQIPLSIQKVYNYTKCDIRISYMPKPVNKTETLETVGTSTFDLKNHKVSVIVYYSEIIEKFIPSQNYGYDRVIQYSDKPMSYFRLKQTISHEIGHALGLAHYYESNEDLVKKWVNGEEMPPSIMTEVLGASEQDFGVTQNDAQQIFLKYGSNGFGGKTFFGIPHEIGNLDNTSKIVQSASDSSGQEVCPNDQSVVKGLEPLLTQSADKTGATVLFQYSPQNLYRKCTNLWTFDFVNEKNHEKHLSNVYYDIFIQQDSVRSVAKTQGKDYFFAADGNATNEIKVEEKEGVVYYWIVMYLVPPKHNDQGVKGGTALIFLNVAQKTLPKMVLTQKEMEPWVKNIARWWSSGEMQDNEFIQSIQYLNQEGFLNLDNNSLSQSNEIKVPSWLRQSAGWWANGQISDNEFFQAIQFLTDSKIMTFQI